jgi:hypothetical protein
MTEDSMIEVRDLAKKFGEFTAVNATSGRLNSRRPADVRNRRDLTMGRPREKVGPVRRIGGKKLPPSRTGHHHAPGARKAALPGRTSHRVFGG